MRATRRLSLQAWSSGNENEDGKTTAPRNSVATQQQQQQQQQQDAQAQQLNNIAPRSNAPRATRRLSLQAWSSGGNENVGGKTARRNSVATQQQTQQLNTIAPGSSPKRATRRLSLQAWSSGNEITQAHQLNNMAPGTNSAMPATRRLSMQGWWGGNENKEGSVGRAARRNSVTTFQSQEAPGPYIAPVVPKKTWQQRKQEELEGPLTPELARKLEARRRAASTLQLDTMSNYLETYRLLMEYGVKESESFHRLVIGLTKAAEKQQEFIQQQEEEVEDGGNGGSLFAMELLQAWQSQVEKLEAVDAKLNKSKLELGYHLKELEKHSKTLQSMRTAEENVIRAWDAYSEVLSRKDEDSFSRRATTSGVSVAKKAAAPVASSDDRRLYEYGDPSETSDPSGVGGDLNESSNNITKNGSSQPAADAWMVEMKYRKALSCQKQQTWDACLVVMQDALMACQKTEVRRRLQLRDAMQVTTQATRQLFQDIEMAQTETQQDLLQVQEVKRQDVEKEVEAAILERLAQSKEEMKKDNQDENDPEKDEASLDITDVDTENVSSGVLSFYQDVLSPLEENDDSKKDLDEAITAPSDRQSMASFYRDLFSSSSPLESDFLAHAALVEIIDTTDLALAVVTDQSLHLFNLPTLSSLEDPVEAAMQQLLVASRSNENIELQETSTLREPWKTLPLNILKVSDEKGHHVLELIPNRHESGTKLCLRTASDDKRTELIHAIEQQQHSGGAELVA